MRPLRFMLHLALRLAGIACLLIPSVCLGVLYGAGRLVFGPAPGLVSVRQAARYLGYTWTVRAPEVDLRFHHRLWLSATCVRALLLASLRGFAWILDEVLYGARLDATEVRAPLIKMSAARSGSTQIARYLEADPRLASPSLLQFLLPYLWLWRLAARCAPLLSRWVTPARIEARFEAAVGQAFIERHEVSLFRTDTFDAALYVGTLNTRSFFLGPQVLALEANLAEAAPHNAALWTDGFVALFDRIARKTLVWHDAGEDQRIFIKGHFLAAADALARRYPDARFLTVIRHPSARLRSTINYMRVNPLDRVLGPPPWRTLGLGLARTEARYCEIEQAWYTRADGPRRCVLRFADYRADLASTMATIYRECLDTDALPAHVPQAHAPRKRSGYAIDRTLAEVGVDQAALEARLADYIAWCSESSVRPPTSRGAPP